MAVERAFRATSPVSQLTSRPFSGKCGFSLTLSGAAGHLRLCPSHTWPPGPLPRSVPGFLASLLSWAPPGKRGPELLCCLRVDFPPSLPGVGRLWHSLPQDLTVPTPPPSVPLPRSEHSSPLPWWEGERQTFFQTSPSAKTLNFKS